MKACGPNAVRASWGAVSEGQLRQNPPAVAVVARDEASGVAKL